MIIIIIIIIIVMIIIIIIMIMIIIIASVPCLGIRRCILRHYTDVDKTREFIIAKSSQYLHIHYIIFLSLF